MMPDDVPPDDWLRDALYKKIRNSSLMMFDIKQYESWIEGDQRRSYRYLLDVIERHISRIREDKHVAAREKFMQETLQVAANPLLLHRIQLPLHQMPIRKRSLKPLPRRRQHLRQRPRLMQLQFYHHLNQNSMQKEKGKVKGKETDDQIAEVLVLDPRRRSHATSISSRKHAEKAKIVNTVTTKRCSMRTR